MNTFQLDIMSTIFHLDLDTFFISVERIIDPSLKGKPVIVGANPSAGRGVVAACSYEAREYGLHSAMPIKQAYKLCPNGIYLRGTIGECSRYSEAVKNVLDRYAPQIEQTSIDEFYMDFTGTEKTYGSMFLFAQKLQKQIKNELDLPSSIGIGSNKTIAKICSDYAKPMGVTYIFPGMEKDFLAPSPVETLPGVGKITLKSLNLKGFHTISDITNSSQDYLSLAYGKAGIDLWNKANGDGKTFILTQHRRKSISKERTYGTDEMSKTKVEETLFPLSSKVCQMLRDRNWQTSTVSIKLRYSDFITITRAKSINPTDDDKKIFETAVKLFRNAYTRRVATRLIGIHLTNFSVYNEQEILFSDENVIRKRMLRAVTKIRDKFGYSSINIGGAN